MMMSTMVMVKSMYLVYAAIVAEGYKIGLMVYETCVWRGSQLNVELHSLHGVFPFSLSWFIVTYWSNLSLLIACSDGVI